MKKVININFQGRVIPIEETAYDVLKQYVESLRRFFANEEGRDEIINDIEGRIAELFSDNLKKGNTCITDEDVNVVINSMGRPEDFDADEAKVANQLGSEQTHTTSEEETAAPLGKGRLYRDGEDKILGGVCAGLAHYLRIDPAIIRILFAVITFGGFGAGFLVYILMWAILPSRSLEKGAIRKRLFRNPEDKVFAGVASGIAAYFNVAVWIPRLIFAFPLVLGIIVSIFRNIAFEFDPAPSIIFGSFGSSFFIVYLILWIVIPEANSASEKLEMRGEKVDLNTIKNTIQEDLQGFKGRAEKWGKEVGSRAQEFGKEFSSTVSGKGKEFGSEVGSAARSGGRRVFNAIGIVFKAFFLFFAGVIAFALLMGLLGLMIGGISVFPLKSFFLEGFWQNFLAWATLIFFLAIPVIAFITWLVRRIMGIRSKNRYLGYTFGGLWFIGLICAACLAGSIIRNFDSHAKEREDYSLAQPSNGKIVMKVADSKVKTYGKWFKMDGILNMTDDSLFLNNVRLNVMKSPDSAFHMFGVRYSAGSDEDVALRNLQQIKYGFIQQDSTVWLDRGFALKRGEKFRDQRVVITLQIPVGKRVIIDRSVARRLNWFHINNGSRDWEDWDVEYEDEYWESNVEYVMTVGGLERVDKKDKREEEVDNGKEQLREIEEQQKQLEEKKKQIIKENGIDVPDSTKTAPVEPAAPKTKRKTETKVQVSETVKDITPDVNISPLSMILMKFTR
jgi:phage shock protein PspC (stress-responsive transcriptional regulator)